MLPAEIQITMCKLVLDTYYLRFYHRWGVKFLRFLHDNTGIGLVFKKGINIWQFVLKKVIMFRRISQQFLYIMTVFIFCIKILEKLIFFSGDRRPVSLNLTIIINKLLFTTTNYIRSLFLFPILILPLIFLQINWFDIKLLFLNWFQTIFLFSLCFFMCGGTQQTPRLQCLWFIWLIYIEFIKLIITAEIICDIFHNCGLGFF